ncbi:MAG TPA: methyltransferase domain-containing protein [Candidatus Acidoferrales bacterium]|nr:methyltransferase domain-containing protein [Candidatus Acidoferrales bacterium]
MNNADKTEPQDSYYVCPVCKQPLTPTTKGLFCRRDEIEYPVKNGIVDFVAEDLMESPDLFLRSVDKLDSAAETYEGPSWLGTFDMISAELGLPSHEDIVKTMAKIIDANHGVGLDVACGTGIVTRSLAQKMRLVYGIDISMGMLEKAVEYAGEGRIGNVCFARSMGEKLPFTDDVFDGVTCSGALHLFQNTAEALKEMARVMKRGARMVVQTFVKQDLSNFRKSFERLGAGNPFVTEALEAVHFFDVEELERYLSQTGFKGFAYNIYGPSILFHAEKG